MSLAESKHSTIITVGRKKDTSSHCLCQNWQCLAGRKRLSGRKGEVVRKEGIGLLEGRKRYAGRK